MKFLNNIPLVDFQQLQHLLPKEQKKRYHLFNASNISINEYLKAKLVKGITHLAEK